MRSGEPFRDFLLSALLAGGPASEVDGGVWAPALDVYETGSDLVIEVELPGTAPGDIHITCHEDVLLIEGAKGDTVPRGEAAIARLLRVERAAGPFRRLVSLPWPVDRSHGRACLRDGVLTIFLPKMGSVRG